MWDYHKLNLLSLFYLVKTMLLTNIKISILTMSDRASRRERDDLSGPELMNYARSLGATIARYEVIPDDLELIKAKLIDFAIDADVVLTTGGTGLTPRDVTPEATLAVIDKTVPGIAEAMRMESLKKTPHAMLSRSVAGALGKTLIINLPGSPKAARENLDAIIQALPHAVEKIQGNTAECG
jgi:molybdenum cofactor synthesis domain-containing protein